MFVRRYKALGSDERELGFCVRKFDSCVVEAGLKSYVESGTAEGED